MSSRILAIATLAASLAALPMLASAQTGTTTTAPAPMPQTTTGTGAQYGTPPGSSGSMNRGSMNTGAMDGGTFNARNYRTGADCLNAATAAHVALSACDHLRKR